MFGIFIKKKRAESSTRIEQTITDYYKVIYPDEIALLREEKRFLDQFRYSFLDGGRCVNTVKRLDGIYIVTDNGRHQMYVARKYGLKLLVHLDRKEVMDFPS